MTKTIAFNPLEYPIYIMNKPVGALCNLDCQYCYYLEKEELYRNRKTNRMSEDLLEKFTQEYIQCQPTPDVLFTWHGGETLLRGIEFFKKAISYQKKYGHGRNIANAIQTNGILLNDDWCRFFKDNNFLVGISIDGPEELHNAYRPDKGGRGSFARVMKGIELLQKHDVEFNTLSVINNLTAKKPLEVYNFFKEIGSQYMQFSPIVERFGTRADGLELLAPKDNTDAEMAPWCVSPIDYGRFYTTIFDEWVCNDVGRYYVQQFDATLACLMEVAPGVCIYGKTCGHAAAMEHNGDVYSCDHFVFPEYKLGNIGSSSLVNMMLSEEQLQFGNNKYTSLPTQCKECDFLPLCHGECPKNRIIKTASGEPGLNYLCAGLRLYFDHVMPYMLFMADELKEKRAPANVMEFARKRIKQK